MRSVRGSAGLSANTPLGNVASGRMAPLLLGNALEWYDFALYGFFATAITGHFFTLGDPQTASLAVAATFGAAFLMRPLGALVIGHFGDRSGRKHALMLSFGLMALGTAMIGLAPTVATLGLTATVIVVAGRLLQGFSAAGEAGSSLTMMVESVPQTRQGQATALLALGAYGGLMLGSLSGLAINALLPEAAARAWGWRLPFIAGLLILPVGLHLRRHMAESPSFAYAAVRESVRRGPAHGTANAAQLLRGIMTMIGLAGFASPVVYLILVFMPTQSTAYFGVRSGEAMLSTTVALTFLMVLLLPMGRLADRLGGRFLMLGSSALGVLLVVPLTLRVVHAPGLLSLLLLQSVLALCLAAYVTGSGPVASGLFSARHRTFGISVGYNLGIVLFGAFAPLVTTWLYQRTGDSLVPAWYVLVAGLTSVATVLTIVPQEPRPT